METKRLNTEGLRTWITISTAALDANLATLQTLAGGRPIMAVVKSNAYGHGLFELAKHFVARGVAWLAVDALVEAIHLREVGIDVPMLVLGYTLPERLAEARDNNISLTVSSIAALNELLASDVDGLKIHIKIDTGLHRQGFLPDEVPALLKTLSAAQDKVFVEGLYTHLADAKRPEGVDYSEEQIATFEKIHGAFTAAGFTPETHISASPVLIRFGPMGDVVRIGAALYGLWHPTLKKEFEKKVTLTPALTWQTIVTETKRLPKGATIGYDRAETLTRDSTVAVCAIGYWHGYPTELSGKGIVVVNGQPAKVLGKVMMDMIVIDVTGIAEVHTGTVATLINIDPDSPVSAEAVAGLAGISVHELCVCLNSRVKRLYA